MKIAKTIGIMNLFAIIGIVLCVVVILINWILGWTVQFLMWIPMCAWAISFIFAFISALKLPGGFFEKRN